MVWQLIAENHLHTERDFGDKAGILYSMKVDIA